MIAALYVETDGCYFDQAGVDPWHEACRKDADDYFNDGGCEEFTSGNEMPFHALYQLEARADA